MRNTSEKSGMKKIVRRIGGVLALMPVAIALFAVGLVLSLSQAYVAVAAELPTGLPGARLAAASTSATSSGRSGIRNGT